MAKQKKYNSVEEVRKLAGDLLSAFEAFEAVADRSVSATEQASDEREVYDAYMTALRIDRSWYDEVKETARARYIVENWEQYRKLCRYQKTYRKKYYYASNGGKISWETAAKYAKEADYSGAGVRKIKDFLLSNWAMSLFAVICFPVILCIVLRNKVREE